MQTPELKGMDFGDTREDINGGRRGLMYQGQIQSKACCLGSHEATETAELP